MLSMLSIFHQFQHISTYFNMSTSFNIFQYLSISSIFQYLSISFSIFQYLSISSISFNIFQYLSISFNIFNIFNIFQYLYLFHIICHLSHFTSCHKMLGKCCRRCRCCPRTSASWGPNSRARRWRNMSADLQKPHEANEIISLIYN